jgi:site-specific recombinase XerD
LKLKTNSSELLKMQYIEQFLEMALAERGIAENTLISYKRDLLDFKVFLQKIKTEELKVTSDNIERYINLLSNN